MPREVLYFDTEKRSPREVNVWLRADGYESREGEPVLSSTVGQVNVYHDGARLQIIVTRDDEAWVGAVEVIVR